MSVESLREDWFEGPFTEARGRKMSERAQMWVLRWAAEVRYQGDEQTANEFTETAVGLAMLRLYGYEGTLFKWHLHT